MKNPSDSSSKSIRQINPALEVDQLISILDELGAYVYIKDLDYRYLYANRLVCDLFGQDLTDVIGKDDHAFFNDETAFELREKVDRPVIEGEQTIERLEVNHSKGEVEPRYYWVTKSPLYNQAGELQGLFGISTDISETKRTEAELKEKQLFLSTILNNIGACVYVKDRDLNFLYINPQTEELFEQTLSQIESKPSIDVIGEEQTAHFATTDLQVFATGKTVTCKESFVTKTGIRHYWSVKVPLFDDKGEVDRLLGMSTDITSQVLSEERAQKANAELQQRLEEISKLKDQLKEQAAHDPLTGLYNRRYMDDFISHELARSERANLKLAMIVLDIDFFKKVNDRFGHKAGDQVLINVADILSHNCRHGDVVCRYGGEEFLVLLTNISEPMALEKAEEIRQKVAQLRTTIDDIEITTTVSAGVACYPDDSTDNNELFLLADAALYEAKGRGRNCVVSARELKS
ncbi:MAG: hypothetical protein AseanaTS_01500 [Candidatus Pelagadaptatus aseana]|uniref:sensor domain-containing diguanylate cyclase n=1 Tax=Candidatus Pelagadaptatus aseana TaxID=3120508 RepID=UPI0039B26577